MFTNDDAPVTGGDQPPAGGTGGDQPPKGGTGGDQPPKGASTLATFQPAFDFTIKHEDATLSGKITVDAGGRTRFGIAQKFHPDLPDSFFDGDKEDVLATAEGIYEHDYWDPMRLGEITNQNIANKLMDMAINMGVHQAVHLAQRAVNGLIASGAQFGPQAPSPVTQLVEDGIIGDHTIAAINAADPIAFHTMLVEVLKAFYIHIATNNPAQAVYLHGWLKRVES